MSTTAKTTHTHIVTLHGEPVTRIIAESDGKPNVHTGSREEAIEYTEAEAAEVVAWIGAGAEAVSVHMNTYDYATDAEMGEIEADTVQEAYAMLRKKLTPAMIADGATLWVENADDESTEPRLTLGLNAD